MAAVLFSDATAQCGPTSPQCSCFEITHTRQDSSEQRSARRRGRYLHNTRQTQETNIHALSGMWTRDPSTQAASYRSATLIGWQQYRFPKLQRTLKLAAAGHSSIPKNRHLCKAFTFLWWHSTSVLVKMLKITKHWPLTTWTVFTNLLSLLLVGRSDLWILLCNAFLICFLTFLQFTSQLSSTFLNFL
jgi:hypothetical protein